jgi:hypothetical protein
MNTEEGLCVTSIELILFRKPLLSISLWLVRDTHLHFDPNRRSRPLTFEQVFDANNYFNVVEVLDNKFRKLFLHSQTYHYHDKDSVELELELETDFYRPEVVLDDIEPVKEEWLKFVINIGKVDGKGPAIYQCLHHIEDKTDKKGEPVRSTCNYKGAKQTVKRHVNSVHFGKRCVFYTAIP